MSHGYSVLKAHRSNKWIDYSGIQYNAAFNRLIVVVLLFLNSRVRNYTASDYRLPSPCRRCVRITVPSNTVADKRNKSKLEIIDAPSSLRADVCQRFGFPVSSNANDNKETNKGRSIRKYCWTMISYADLTGTQAPRNAPVMVLRLVAVVDNDRFLRLANTLNTNYSILRL